MADLGKLGRSTPDHDLEILELGLIKRIRPIGRGTVQARPRGHDLVLAGHFACPRRLARRATDGLMADDLAEEGRRTNGQLIRSACLACPRVLIIIINKCPASAAPWRGGI